MCALALKELRERAIGEFINRLKQMEGEQLLQVVLFGSVARGCDRDDSDIDLLVVIDKKFESQLLERCEADKIVDLAFDVDVAVSERQTILSPFVVTRTEYEAPLRDLIFHKIEDEGIVQYAAEQGRTAVSY